MKRTSALTVQSTDAWNALLWLAVVLVSALAAAAVGLFGAVTPLRPLIIFWFLLICPGMALIRLLRLENLGAEWTLAVALSLALDAIVAAGMVYAGGWSPAGGLVTLIAISLGGAALQVAQATGWLAAASRWARATWHAASSALARPSAQLASEAAPRVSTTASTQRSPAVATSRGWSLLAAGAAVFLLVVSQLGRGLANSAVSSAYRPLPTNTPVLGVTATIPPTLAGESAGLVEDATLVAELSATPTVPTATSTQTSTPSDTVAPTETMVSSATPTPTTVTNNGPTGPGATNTIQPSDTPTLTPVATDTPDPNTNPPPVTTIPSTATMPPRVTPVTSVPETVSPTPTATYTPTGGPSPTRTSTGIPTSTRTPSALPSATATNTPPAPTQTHTPLPTNTVPPSPTQIPSQTPTATTPPTFKISGKVNAGRHQSEEDILISLSDGTSTFTDHHGHYDSHGHPAGTYTITPGKDGCEFSPPSLTIVVIDENSGGNNFDADCHNHDRDDGPVGYLAPLWQVISDLIGSVSETP
jgi:hypothetical protein